jgi:hypothetical protein
MGIGLKAHPSNFAGLRVRLFFPLLSHHRRKLDPSRPTSDWRSSGGFLLPFLLLLVRPSSLKLRSLSGKLGSLRSQHLGLLHILRTLF